MALWLCQPDDLIHTLGPTEWKDRQNGGREPIPMSFPCPLYVMICMFTQSQIHKISNKKNGIAGSGDTHL